MSLRAFRVIRSSLFIKRMYRTDDAEFSSFSVAISRLTPCRTFALMSEELTLDVSTALDRVLKRFAGLVRAIGARHRLSVSDLDEVMQDVRIRLWRARSTREQIEGLPTSYVYRTAVAAAVDLLRKRRSGVPGEADPLEAAADVADVHDATRDAEDREGVERIMAVVDALPDARRAVVRMHLMGYEREEIGKLLGWTDGKTRNLLYRGLADLRELLGERARGSE
jgi:RNA polymerase sigma-70 factor (ECF subfamily)